MVKEGLEVRDRFGLVYGILVVLGVGTLLPWNVFITEKEFFDIRLHVPPASPAVADNYISLFGLVFNGANLLALCLVICLQANLSLRTQILNPLVLIFIVLASTAALTLRLDLSGAAVAYYSLPALAVLGASMAVLQGGMLNLASMFPPIYIQGYVVGAGLSGCATSLLSFASQLEASSGGGARTPADVAPAALVYFGAAAAITAACVGCFALLPRLKYARVRLEPLLAGRRAAALADAAGRDLAEQLLLPGPGGEPPLPGALAFPPLPPGKDPDALPSYDQLPPLPPHPQQQPHGDYYHQPPQQQPPPHQPQQQQQQQQQWRPHGGPFDRSYYFGGGGGGAAAAHEQQQPLLPDAGLRAATAHDAAAAAAAAAPQQQQQARGSSLPFVGYALSMVLTMCCSLAVWPGVTAFICSVDNPATVSPCAPTGGPSSGSGGGGFIARLTGDLFVPVTFVVFGVGDLVGRVASSWGPWGRRPPAALSLVAYAAARFAVAGALLVCHVVTPTPWRLPSLFTTDLAPLGLITLLGLTQGHLLSTACMHAPAVVPPGKEAEFGPVTGFCITAGCLAGSGSLYFIMRALTGGGG